MKQIPKLPTADILPWEQKASIINRVIDVLLWISPLINPECGKVAPPTTVQIDGFIAYADGVNWDPAGDGTKGLFRWNGAAWVFVG